MTTFEDRVQSLPAEIYIEIYDLTFKTSPGVVCVDKGYRPPALLHVDQTSRKEFAKSYFGNDTIFNVAPKIASTWLRSTGGANFDILSEVRIANRTILANNLVALNLYAALYNELIDLIGSPLSSEGLRINPNYLKFHVSYGEPEKKVWVALQDFAKGNPNGWAARNAREWCEWKFGK